MHTEWKLLFDTGVTNGYLPKRFKYPKKEVAINQEHVEEAVKRQDPNEISTPVWWDVKGN
ncbi:MAG: SusD/RagB family nutrient-binding outer membrane lipoprotein [Bacteroidales bacterium]|nr:SusD/RagB family nutrient-binding outer membrane lipoprotein [Bacteroidales bacterium]